MVGGPQAPAEERRHFRYREQFVGLKVWRVLAAAAILGTILLLNHWLSPVCSQFSTSAPTSDRQFFGFLIWLTLDFASSAMPRKLTIGAGGCGARG